MSEKLFMESTEVPPERTAAEIVGELVAAGATKIMHEYGQDGQLAGITFSIPRSGVDVPFRLPVKTEPIFKIINGRRKWSGDRSANAPRDLAQAKRTAWRQLFRWVQAQLALIKTGMVQTEEVFLPYMLTRNNQTLYEQIKDSGFKALPAPKDDEPIRDVTCEVIR